MHVCVCLICNSMFVANILKLARAHLFAHS